MKRRVSLKVLRHPQPGDLSKADVAAELLLAERPRTRGDCSPDPLTVTCPIPSCSADPGENCLQLDQQSELPVSLRTNPPLLGVDGQPLRGGPHFARIEEARAPHRPCAFVSCKAHLYLDVEANGSIVYNYPKKDVTELDVTCALDLAEYGGMTLEEVGERTSLTRERIRQIEIRGLEDLRESAARLLDFDEVKLDAEALAKRTTFTQPQRKETTTGNCTECGSPRRLVGGRWKCQCWGSRMTGKK